MGVVRGGVGRCWGEGGRYVVIGGGGGCAV